MEPLLSLLITLLIYCLLLYVVWWVLTLFPLPQPAEKIKTVVFAIIALLVLLSLIVGVAPLPLLRLK